MKRNLVAVENIRLFSARSVMKEYFFRGNLWRKLPMYWFVHERKTPVFPYHLVIKDYRKGKDKMHLYPEDAINELFTEKEINAFSMYLQKAYQLDCEINEVELPIEFNRMGHVGIPIDSITDWYQIHLEDTYYLPFKVNGFFRTTWIEEE